MVEHFSQVIWCQDRENRAFLREVSFTPNNARVTGIEKLPPNYDIALARMADPNEKILKTNIKIEGYTGCPYCGNRIIFYCDECGKISCAKGGQNHFCPGCRKVHGVMDAECHRLSKSGLLGPAPERIEVLRPAGFADYRYGPVTEERRRDYHVYYSPRPEIGTPSAEKTRVLDNVRRFLEEKKKFQIEDKRDKR